MAYNYYPQYYPYVQQQAQLPGTQMPLAQQMQQPQIQNGGFISVRNEEEARNYPVAPGMSVTFIDESRQKVYSKTMGFSQLDRPVFYTYRLVKEEAQEPQNEPLSTSSDKSIEYLPKAEFEAFRGLYEGLVADVEELKRKQAPKKKEADDK